MNLSNTNKMHICILILILVFVLSACSSENAIPSTTEIDQGIPQSAEGNITESAEVTPSPDEQEPQHSVINSTLGEPASNTTEAAIPTAPVAADLMGNTSGNTMNAGLAAVWKDVVYYSDEFGGNIHRLNPDGSDEVLVHYEDSILDNLNVYKDNLYFIVNSKGYGPVELHKADLNGQNPVLLKRFEGEQHYSHCIVANDWIYISVVEKTGADAQLVKMKTDGSEFSPFKLKLREIPKYLNYAEGKLYYLNRFTFEDMIYSRYVDKGGALCLNDDQVINNDGTRGFVYQLQTAGDWIYYHADSEDSTTYMDSLFMMKKDGSNQMYLLSGISEFNVFGDNLYYVDKKSGNVYMANALDPHEGTKMVVENREGLKISNINIAGDWLIARCVGSDNHLTVRTFPLNKKAITSGTNLSIDIFQYKGIGMGASEEDVLKALGQPEFKNGAMSSTSFLYEKGKAQVFIDDTSHLVTGLYLRSLSNGLASGASSDQVIKIMGKPMVLKGPEYGDNVEILAYQVDGTDINFFMRNGVLDKVIVGELFS